MTFRDLQAHLSQLSALRFRNLDEDGLVGSARLYAALYTTVTVNSLDEELAPRRMLRSRLTSLLVLLLERSDAHADLRSRLRLLDTALRLLNTSGALFDRELDLACCRSSDELINNYLSVTQPSESTPPQTLYGILRLIGWRLGGIVPEDAREDPWFSILHRCVMHWVSELLSADGWEGLDDDEAQERLLPMLMSSDLLPSPLPDAFLRKAFERYCLSRRLGFVRVDEAARDELRSYCTLYDTLRLLSFCGVDTHACRSELAALAERQMGNFGEETGEAQLCLSIVLEHFCDTLPETFRPRAAVPRP